MIFKICYFVHVTAASDDHQWKRKNCMKKHRAGMVYMYLEHQYIAGTNVFGGFDISIQHKKGAGRSTKIKETLTLEKSRKL